MELAFEWWGWVGNDEVGSFVTGMADCAGIVSDSDLVLIGMGMRCGRFAVCFGVDYIRFGGNDHYFRFPPFSLDFHHFRCGSSLFPWSHSDNALECR